MLNLPKSTEVKKQIPKHMIFSKFDWSTQQKERFDADISRIYIVNELAERTVNIATGDTIKAIFVLHIQLKQKDFDERNIVAISKMVNQNIVYVLEFDGLAQLAIYHSKLMCTNWREVEGLSIQLRGMNFDTVWETLVAEIGTVTVEEGNTLDEQLAQDEHRAKLEKQIATLEKKARAERQPQKKMAFFEELKRLQKELG